jgi:hypothetical protein
MNSRRHELQTVIIAMAREIARRPRDEQVHGLAKRLQDPLEALDVEIMSDELAANDFEDQP